MTEPPKPLELTAEDTDALERLPLSIALEGIKKRHREVRCIQCYRFVGNHSLKQMKSCMASYWKKPEPTNEQ